MQLSVIICVHNPKEPLLLRVLNGLQQQTLSKDQWELIFVDNASTEPVKRDLSWHRNARHESEPQLGLTNARLRGMSVARGALYVFVDDDTILQADYLEEALKIGSRYPFLGAWGGTNKPEFESTPADWTREYWGWLSIREVKGEIWCNSPIFDFAQPSGAGLCLRSCVADVYRQEVAQDKVRKRLGRTGNSLLSGEDGDMIHTSLRKQLGWGVFPQLVLTHVIPAHRLTEEYLLRLVRGITASATVLQVRRGEPVVVETRSGEFVTALKIFARRGLRAARFHLALCEGIRDGMLLVNDQGGGKPSCAEAAG